MKKIVVLVCVFALFVPGSVVFAQWHVQEDFEGGVVPPAGWSEYQLGDAVEGWDAGYLGHPSSYDDPTPHSGAYYLFHNDEDVAAGCVSWMVSPAFTYAAGDMVVFWEDNAWIDLGFYGLHAVWISTASGDPNDGLFVQMTEYASTLSAWTERTIDLSTFATPGDTCYIAFLYMGDWDAEWYVDDVSIGQDLWVDLLSFTARQTVQGVALTWVTGAEIDSLGFNILRKNIDVLGDFNLTKVINEKLIPSEGTAYSGATYTIIDSQVRPQAHYRYYLEEVGLDSESTVLGDVDITLDAGPVWQ